MHRGILIGLLLGGLLLLGACGDKSDKSGKATGQSEKASKSSKSGKVDVKGPLEIPKSTGTPAGAPEHGLDDALKGRIQASLAKARTFLLTQQEPSGGFTDRGMEGVPANVGFTSMAVAGLVAATPKTQVEKDAAIRKGCKFLVSFQQKDGAIVDDPKNRNYCTSASIAALAAARIADFRNAQAHAMSYLEGSQIQDESKVGSYGGFPYADGKDQVEPADGSNAFMAAVGLEAGGLAADSPVRKRVERFASGLQNRAESNAGEMVVEVDGDKRTVVAGGDGGGYYRPGDSKAGMIKRPDGKWILRSYGSMTYAVLKLMLFAGVDVNDPRVQALVGWISNHWTVERNPGFEEAENPKAAGQQGWFYYLHSAARALAAFEEASGKPLVVRDAEGRKHNWRLEIAEALLQRQNDDGSWRNPVDRWMEASSTLATSFAMQTLGVLTGRP